MGKEKESNNKYSLDEILNDVKARLQGAEIHTDPGKDKDEVVNEVIETVLSKQKKNAVSASLETTQMIYDSEVLPERVNYSSKKIANEPNSLNEKQQADSAGNITGEQNKQPQEQKEPLLSDLETLVRQKAERTRVFKAKVEAQKELEREIFHKRTRRQEKTKESEPEEEVKEYKTVQDLEEDKSPAISNPLENESFRKTYTQYAQNRRQKIDNFELKQTYQESFRNPSEGDSKLQQIDFDLPESTEDLEEYRSVGDTQKIFSSIKELKRSSRMHISILLLLLIFMSYLVIANLVTDYQIAPDVLLAQVNPVGYVLANLVPLLIAVFISWRALFSGFVSFFTFHANRESFYFLTVLGVLIQNIVALIISIFEPSEQPVTLFTIMAIFALFLNAVAKLDIGNRVMRNFRFVASRRKEKYSIHLKEGEYAEDITRGLLKDRAKVAYEQRVDFLTDFMATSFSEDSSDNLSKIFAPIVLICAIAAGIFACVAGGSFQNEFITAFTATLCMASPACYILAVNRPLSAASASLKQRGVVLGEKAVQHLAESNACVITADKLFPKDTVLLQGIKTFSGARVDEAILDAASILYKSHSVLWSIFSKIITGRKELLKEVDTVVYEDTMGISAWVDNRRVLIGNRELMKHHGIIIPSKVYESQYISSEREKLVYLANSGELVAVFVVNLIADDDIFKAIDTLDRQDIFLVVKTVDPMITTQRLGEIFHKPAEMFKIMPSRHHNEYEESVKPQKKASGKMASDGKFPSMVQTISKAKKIRSTSAINLSLMIAAIILGIVLGLFFSFIGSIDTLTIEKLTLFQFIWLLCTLVIPKIKGI